MPTAMMVLSDVDQPSVRSASTCSSSSSMVSTSTQAAVKTTAQKAVMLIVPPLKKAKTSSASSIPVAEESSIPSDPSDPSNPSGPIVIDDDEDVVDNTDSPAAELDAEAELGAFTNPTSPLCMLTALLQQLSKKRGVLRCIHSSNSMPFVPSIIMVALFISSHMEHTSARFH